MITAVARLTAALVTAVALAIPAQAQTVHRANVSAGDAMPTGGSFSIRFPVPFTDVEMRAEEPGTPAAIVRMVTGVNREGIRFSATEMPNAGRPLAPLETFMDSMKEKPGWTIASASRERMGDLDTLTFAATAPRGGYYFRMLRANSTVYTQVIQFPEAQRSKAAELKDEFFGSFRIMPP